MEAVIELDNVPFEDVMILRSFMRLLSYTFLYHKLHISDVSSPGSYILKSLD